MVIELILFLRACFIAASFPPSFTAKSERNRKKVIELSRHCMKTFTNTGEAGSYRTTCQLRVCYAHAMMIIPVCIAGQKWLWSHNRNSKQKKVECSPTSFTCHDYSRSSLNGHSRKRTALLMATLFETPF